MHHAWIQELFRVIKPNGIVVFTTQGDRFIESLLPSEKDRYAAGELVIRGRVEEGKKDYSAFHPPEYVRNKLLKDRIILDNISDPAPYHLEQEVWVARRHA